MVTNMTKRIPNKYHCNQVTKFKFSTTARSKGVFQIIATTGITGNRNMAAQTGNTYISLERL